MTRSPCEHVVYEESFMSRVIYAFLILDPERFLSTRACWWHKLLQGMEHCRGLPSVYPENMR